MLVTSLFKSENPKQSTEIFLLNFSLIFFNRAQYNWNVDWKLCKPIRIDKIGADYRSIKTDYNAIFKDTLQEQEQSEDAQSEKNRG